MNLALAHEEGRRRGANDVRFAVCSSLRNDALLDGGRVLTDFQKLLRKKDDVHFIDLDALLAQLHAVVPDDMKPWPSALADRYGMI